MVIQAVLANDTQSLVEWAPLSQCPFVQLNVAWDERDVSLKVLHLSVYTSLEISIYARFGACFTYKIKVTFSHCIGTVSLLIIQSCSSLQVM